MASFLVFSTKLRKIVFYKTNSLKSNTNYISNLIENLKIKKTKVCESYF